MGYNGSGTFNQSGGTNTVTGDLFLGYGTNAIGTYNLSAAASWTAYNEYVGGYSGTGTFNQTGGTNIVTNNLYLGYNHRRHRHLQPERPASWTPSMSTSATPAPAPSTRAAAPTP